MSTFPANSDLPQSGSVVSRWLLDEASGTRADNVGSNDLSDNNTVGSGAGLDVENATFDNSADFEADNSEYLDITDASQSGLDITGDLTKAFWVNVESAPSDSDYFLLAKWTSTGDERSYMVQYRDSGGTKELRFFTSSDGTATNESNVAITQDLGTATWKHVVVVYDASAGSAEFYVDGSSIGSGTGLATSLHSGSAPFVIGRQDGASQHYDGLMQDAIIWDTALTDAEVSSLYDLYTVKAGIVVPTMTLLGVG